MGRSYFCFQAKDAEIRPAGPSAPGILGQLGITERRLRLAGLHAQRAEITRMVSEHLIDTETARRLLLELDGQEAWLIS